MADKQNLERLSKKVESIEKELSSIKSELRKLSSEDTELPISETSLKPNIIKPNIKEPIVAQKPAKNFDWEVLLGGNILGKLGLTAILLACVWFISFAFDNNWINESGRIYIGLFIGLFTVSSGLFLAKRKMKVVPESVIGTGVSIIFVSLYGAYYYYDLINAEETFGAFTLLTIGTSLLAGRMNLQILYIFSLFGSIMAPILLSSGENSYRFLFTYLTIINLVFLYISKTNPWRVSPFIVLLSNFIIYTGWANDKLEKSSPFPPLLYLLGLFLVFGMREVYFMPRLRKAIFKSSLLHFLILLILYCGLGFWVVNHFYSNLTPHFLLLQAFLLVGFLKIYEVYSIPLISSDSNSKKSFSGILFISWLSILFASISNFSSDKWITLSWILFAGGISLIGSYFRNKMYLVISLIPWFLALTRLYFRESFYDRTDFFILNIRFGLFALATFFLLFTYQIQKKDRIHSFIVGFVFTALFTLIIGTLVEVRYLVANPYYRNLGYSYVIAFYMIALLVPGFKLSYRSFRLTGVILGVLLVSKFFLYDIWTMSIIVRIIAGFSLGIGLVILSIVYQKYKDKIKVNQILKLTVFPLLFLAFFNSKSLSADPFKNSGFKFYTEVKGLTKELVSDESLIYGKVRLTEEISRHHGSADLRLVYNNELVPFFHRRVTKVAGKTGKTVPMVVYTNVTSNGRIYVLKLEEPPTKTEYTELEIGGTERYETGLYISLGDEPNNWQESVSASIYNYYDDQIGKVNRIQFRSGKYRYARLEFDSKLQFEFTGALYSPTKEKAENKLDIKLEDLKISNDTDSRATLYYYENPLHKSISRIVLNFEEEKYQRTLEIYQKDINTKEYVLMSEIVIYKKPEAKGEHSIDLPFYNGGDLKIAIVDNDNKPLNLISIDAYSEVEELIFEIPRIANVDDSFPFVLYYGNEYVRFPEFDLKNTYDEKLRHVSFTVNEHKLNSEFGYSVVEPPFSSWVIRGVFLIGLLGMAYPAYSILKRYKSELDFDKTE